MRTPGLLFVHPGKELKANSRIQKLKKKLKLKPKTLLIGIFVVKKLKINTLHSVLNQLSSRHNLVVKTITFV